MGGDRRKFLKVAGLTIFGIGANGAARVLGQTPPPATDTAQPAGGLVLPPQKRADGKPVPGVEQYDNALTATRWAMVIDPRKCQEAEDCHDCIDACHLVHNVPDFTGIDEDIEKEEIKWIWKEQYEHAFPDTSYDLGAGVLRGKMVTVLCNHCKNPPCVRVCPTQATWKRESDGIVMMDMHRCIGCRFCMAACPYGSRSFNWKDPRKGLDMDNLNTTYPTRQKGVVEKCTFCAERLAKGLMPACVTACKHGALKFGDLDDENSEVRKILETHYTIRRKPQLGTEPMVYYLIS